MSVVRVESSSASRIALRAAAGAALAAVLFAASPASAQTARGLANDPSVAAAGTYTLDKRHTTLIVRINHMGYSNFTMRFNRISGTVDFDPKDPTRSKLDVSVDPTSVDTGLPDFDKDIAEKVFGAPGDPIRFVSTQIERTGPDTGKVTGDLTFHGVTKPVVLDVRFNGTGPGLAGKPRLGFSATGAFKRSDFKADNWSQFASDVVRLQIETEFSK